MEIMGDWNMNQINANAPTPAEIMELVRENERLEQVNLELAANVEACCELVNMDMGSAIDRLIEIDNTESKALLNKFAIEQQISALDDLSIGPNNESEDRVCRIIEERIEQLRDLIDSDKI